MPVDQGGIAAAGALLVAACGWVAGDERREGGGGNAAADPAPEVAPFPGRHDAPPTPEPVPHAAPGWTLAQHCLARYLEQGVDGITDLNGSYAVALWDGRRRELYLTQDRFGSAGLYLGIDGDRLLFASRPRALAGRVGAELDAEALGHLLTVGHLLGDRTLFRRIRALGPGEIVIWTDRRLARRSAWTWPRPTDLADTPRRRAAAIEELDAALEAAVADTVAAAGQGVDVVLPLSGGLDSRVLLGYLCRHLEPRTVSYGHRHCRDRRYGARLAQVCGVPHRHVELEPDYMARFGPALVARTEGQASIHAAHLLCLEETVRQRPVLVVSGFFGGTLFGSRRADLLDVVASGNGAAAGNGAVTASDRCEAALRIARGYRVGPGDAELRQLLIPPLAGI
ncbi:MAG: asparagine synthase-related protein, partial [Candidatus Eiseniibacteriota bacterium]